MSTPYWAIGNDELAELQKAPIEGTLVECPHCVNKYPVCYGGSLGYVKCDGKSYIVAIEGKLLEKNRKIGTHGLIELDVP